MTTLQHLFFLTQVEWTNSGELLAVAGHLPDEGCTVGAATANPVRNVVKFYTRNGTVRYTHHLPLGQVRVKRACEGV